MNFKRKSSYVIVFIFIDILLCASLYFIIDATNINLLKKEIFPLLHTLSFLLKEVYPDLYF